MRWAAIVLAVLAVPGCGGPAAPAPDSGAPTRTEQTRDQAPAKAPKATDDSAPTGPAVDCGSSLSAADIQRVCAAETQQEITRGEGGHPLNTCSRKFRAPQSRSVSFKLAVHPSLEKVSAIAVAEGATSIPDLGDAAYAYVEDKGGMFDWHTVEVRTGEKILYLRSINESGGTPVCSLEQLTQLARDALVRLQTG